ncbi:MAG: methyltransferase domain-containing protein [Actinomycetota bacterium]
MIKHLDYDEPVLGYHRVLAGLAAELADEGAQVADIGCGPGQILGRLAALRPDLRLTGFDGDQECLRLAEERCPTARMVIADIGNLTNDVPAGDRYQVLISSHSLEHLADPVRALRRWSRLLTPGGRIVLAVPNSLQPLMMARALARRPKANDGHYYIWDRATFENFCRLAGFRIVDRALDYVPLVPVRIRIRVPAIASVERGLLGPLPQFSNSHIVTLEPAT